MICEYKLLVGYFKFNSINNFHIFIFLVPREERLLLKELWLSFTQSLMGYLFIS